MKLFKESVFKINSRKIFNSCLKYLDKYETENSQYTIILPKNFLNSFLIQFKEITNFLKTLL